MASGHENYAIKYQTIMDALAGYGSDSSSSPSLGKQPNALSSLVGYSDDEEENATEDKISKSHNRNTNNISALPKPRLSTEDDSMILRPEDHFSSNYGNPSTEEKKSSQLLNKDWIKTLKSKREFHNPAFFHTMVGHFGIQEPLGTNIRKEKFHEYEYDLVRLEEECRMREQQQNNSLAATTAFAQQQMERAMHQRASHQP